MRSYREGELVTVSREDETLDGIVAHVESIVKIVVAVPDEERGAILRTVHPRALAERTGDGPDDQSLRRLVERSGSGRGAGRSGGGSAGGRRGHTRTAGHRTTGK